jgi:hypothetical protein
MDLVLMTFMVSSRPFKRGRDHFLYVLAAQMGGQVTCFKDLFVYLHVKIINDKGMGKSAG